MTTVTWLHVLMCTQAYIFIWENTIPATQYIQPLGHPPELARGCPSAQSLSSAGRTCLTWRRPASQSAVRDSGCHSPGSGRLTDWLTPGYWYHLPSEHHGCYQGDKKTYCYYGNKNLHRQLTVTTETKIYIVNHTCHMWCQLSTWILI